MRFDLDALLFSIAAVLIGVSKSAFGGGTGSLVAPFLSLRMSSRKVIGLMLPMLLATDVVNCLLYWKQWSVHHWLWLTPTSVCGIFVGARILRDLNDLALRRTIALIAIGFALFQLYRSPSAPQPDWVGAYWFGATMGFLAGIFSVIAHVGGILTTMYLVAQHLKPAEFVATAAAVYFVQNLVKLVPYISQKLITREGLVTNARLLPLLVLGAFIGKGLNHACDHNTFMRAVLVLMLITGGVLLAQTGREQPGVSDTIEFVPEVVSADN